MSNPNKKKGTVAETRVCRFLRERCHPSVKVSRQALSGSKDRGDILIKTPFNTVIVEVKGGKQTANPSRKQIIEWKRQASDEAYNAMYYDHDTEKGRDGDWEDKDCYVPVLVVVRYNRKIEDADVYVGDRVHMWLDDFAFYVYPYFDYDED